MSYVVKIAGAAVDVEAGTLDVTNEIGQRSQCTFTACTGTGIHWDQGTQVQVYDDTGALRYSGFIDTSQTSKPGFAPILYHAVTCMDNHYLADKRLAFQSYLTVSAGSIVQSLWQNYLQPEGVTLGPIAAGIIIPEAIWNGTQVSKALDWLAQQCGYWWQIDEQKRLWFQPYGGLSAPFTLDGTQVAQNDKLSITWGNRQYRNRQFLVGGKDRTSLQHETRHGDGTTRAFTLSYPVAILTGKDKTTQQPRGIFVNGVQQTVASKTKTTTAQWYYAIADAVLAQDPSQPVLQSTDALDIWYEGEYPVVALAQNSALIAHQRQLEGGGTGYVEARESNTKIHTLAAGFQIAQAELAHYGQSMTTLVWAAPAARIPNGLATGQLLNVNLADFDLSEQMLVRSVEITDNTDNLNVWYIVTCIGSPYDVSWQTFFQTLLNQNGAADTTDPANQDGSAILATLFQVQLARTPAATVTATTAACPICGPNTLCGPNTVVC